VARYIVERYLPDHTDDDLRLLFGRIAAATAASADTGVRYLRSVLLPGDDTCLCEYEADSAEAVTAVNELAGLPVHRVVLAVDGTVVGCQRGHRNT
jgi:hypothetical protein